MESAVDANVSPDLICPDRDDSELSLLQEFQDFENQVYSGTLFDKNKPTAASIDGLDRINYHTNGPSKRISGNNFLSDGEAMDLHSLPMLRFKGSAYRSAYHGLKNAYSVQQLPTIDSESELDVEFVNPHPVLVHAQEDPIETHDQVLAQMNSSQGGATPLPTTAAFLVNGVKTTMRKRKTSESVLGGRQIDGQADGQLTDNPDVEEEEVGEGQSRQEAAKQNQAKSPTAKPVSMARLASQRVPEFELKSRLEEEAAIRRQQEDYIAQLQKCYDNLLAKHALAEVTIDQLRMGSVSARPSSTLVAETPRDSYGGDPSVYRSTGDLAGSAAAVDTAGRRRRDYSNCWVQSSPHLVPTGYTSVFGSWEASQNSPTTAVESSASGRTQSGPAQAPLPGPRGADGETRTRAAGQVGRAGHSPDDRQSPSTGEDSSCEEYPFGRYPNSRCADERPTAADSRHHQALPSTTVDTGDSSGRNQSGQAGAGGQEAVVQLTAGRGSELPACLSAVGVGSSSDLDLLDAMAIAEQQQQEQQLTAEQVQQTLSDLLAGLEKKLDQYKACFCLQDTWSPTGVEFATSPTDIAAFRYMLDRLVRCHQRAKRQWQVGDLDSFLDLDERFLQLHLQLDELSSCFGVQVDCPPLAHSSERQLPRTSDCAELVLVTTDDDGDCEEELRDGSEGDAASPSTGRLRRPNALSPGQLDELNRQYTELMKLYNVVKRQQLQHEGSAFQSPTMVATTKKQLISLTKHLNQLASLADGQSRVIPSPEDLKQILHSDCLLPSSDGGNGILDQSKQPHLTVATPANCKAGAPPTGPRQRRLSDKRSGTGATPKKSATGSSRLPPPAPQGGHKGSRVPPSSRVVGSNTQQTARQSNSSSSTCSSASSCSSVCRHHHHQHQQQQQQQQQHQQQQYHSPDSHGQHQPVDSVHLSDSGLADMTSETAVGRRKHSARAACPPTPPKPPPPPPPAPNVFGGVRRGIAELRDSLTSNEQSLAGVEGDELQLNERLNALEASVQLIQAHLHDFESSLESSRGERTHSFFFPSSPRGASSSSLRSSRNLLAATLPPGSPTTDLDHYRATEPSALFSPSSDGERKRKLKRAQCRSRRSTDQHQLPTGMSSSSVSFLPQPTQSPVYAFGADRRVPRQETDALNSPQAKPNLVSLFSAATAHERLAAAPDEEYLTQRHGEVPRTTRDDSGRSRLDEDHRQAPATFNLAPPPPHVPSPLTQAYPSLLARTLSRVDLHRDSYHHYYPPSLPQLAYQTAPTGSLPGLYAPASFSRLSFQAHHRVYTPADNEVDEAPMETPGTAEPVYSRFWANGLAGRTALVRYPVTYAAEQRVISSSRPYLSPTTADWKASLREYRDWGGHRYLVQDMVQQQQQHHQQQHHHQPQHQQPPTTCHPPSLRYPQDYPYGLSHLHGLHAGRVYAQSLSDNLHLCGATGAGVGGFSNRGDALHSQAGRRALVVRLATGCVDNSSDSGEGEHHADRGTPAPDYLSSFALRNGHPVAATAMPTVIPRPISRI